MFRSTPLRASDLGYADGEFSLTFDDGPTPGATAEAARLLADRAIPATFFILGEHAEPELLRHIASHGHTIGNHTFGHPNFDDPRVAPLQTVVPDQIARCHERIKDFAAQQIPFRAPYGSWVRPVCHSAANTLPQADRYIGPYHWDIDAGDWRLNRRPGHPDKTTLDQFRRFFTWIITAKRRGIILLHDGFANCEADSADLQELQVMHVLTFVINEITRRGFRFVNLKTPPACAEDIPPLVSARA